LTFPWNEHEKKIIQNQMEMNWENYAGFNEAYMLIFEITRKLNEFT